MRSMYVANIGQRIRINNLVVLIFLWSASSAADGWRAYTHLKENYLPEKDWFAAFSNCGLALASSPVSLSHNI